MKASLFQKQDFEVWAERVVELQKKINDETDPEKLTKYNASLADYKSKLADARSELDGYAKSITGTDAESVKWKNTLMEQIEGIDRVLYSADELNKIKFDKVFNADDFKESKDALLELAKAGEVTPETIESYDEFNKLIADTGLTAQDIANEINAASEKADNDINNNISSISGLISELENTVNGLEDLNSAYEKVSDGKVYRRARSKI